MLTLLLGGARSGKSALAVALGRAHDGPVTFVATGQITDAAMQARIERHQRERPAHWQTIEEPLDLARPIQAAPQDECLIIDCLSIWTATAMTGRDTDGVEELAARVAGLAAARPGPTIAVSNEVGMSVHPSTEVGCAYRDVHGRVNAIWARAAHSAHLVVAGRLLVLAAPTDVLGELA